MPARGKWLAFALVGTGAAALLAACTAVLGLGDYVIDKDASSSSETSVDGPNGDAASCDVDLTVQCYACPPETNEQILNTCVEGACVQFDETRLDGLLEDGGLPPLPAEPPVPPPADAGAG